MIYRHALVSETRLAIDKLRHTEPPLLHTCRQIRAEASSIFHLENKFAVHLYDLPECLVPPRHHWVWSHTQPGEVVIVSLHNHLRWPAVKYWLYAVHVSTIKFRRFETGTRSMNNIVNDALRIVRRERGKLWEDTKWALERHKVRSVIHDGIDSRRTGSISP